MELLQKEKRNDIMQIIGEYIDMAKRVPKASKHRLVVLSPLILGMTVYFLFTVGYYGFKLISLKNEEMKLSDELYTLQSEEEQLKTEIQKLKNPEYLARYARENFLYSKDGEYIIMLEDNENYSLETNSFLIMIEKYFWYFIVALSVGIVMFIVLVFKKNKQKSSSY